MQFYIVLFEGTDILKFGMTSEEVKAVLGKNPQLFKKNQFDVYMTEDYKDICHVFYNESGCVAFEFFSPSQVFYQNTQLIDQERANVEGLFKDMKGYENKSDMFSVCDGDLGFYAPFGKMESVYISLKGYSAEQNEFYKKKYDEKYGL